MAKWDPNSDSESDVAESLEELMEKLGVSGKLF